MTYPERNALDSPSPLGRWVRGEGTLTEDTDGIRSALSNLHQPVVVVATKDGFAIARGGNSSLFIEGNTLRSVESGYPIAAILPSLPPGNLGDASFLEDHALKYPYMTGAMANGIASVEIVAEMAKSGMLGSFGAAGLSLDRISEALDRIQSLVGTATYCANLIHSPNDAGHEMATAELYLKRGVPLVEASAYLDLTAAIVRYRVAGFRGGVAGIVVPMNRVIAKISRVEVATKFLSPPPERLLKELLAGGMITEQQAQLASRFPVADDITVEADSGGHTDNRPAITLLPTILALRDRLQAQFKYAYPPRVGLAGGIATPASVAGAFAMGAAYIVTGSVNQACLESGSSPAVRKMLGEAGQADVTMAPAADMFEMGVKVQVLKRGTMFAMRAGKLYELYRQYPSWEAIPDNDRGQVEKTQLKRTFEEVWSETRQFFERRDPAQVRRADADPKHKMALVFRWYLGLSSRWANAGDPARQLDYQVWCGPSMGAFNEWTKGSTLEKPENRTVTGVALNLLYGACIVLRRQSLKQQGVNLSDDHFPLAPLSRAELGSKLV